MAITALSGLMLADSAGAAPAAIPGPTENPAITLAAGGCGPGYHRRFGRPFDECVPNGYGPGPAYRRACAPGWHWAEWRGPYGRLHAECVPNR
jgi:hypothetical protein